jgi:hypothetical protein
MREDLRTTAFLMLESNLISSSTAEKDKGRSTKKIVPSSRVKGVSASTVD